MGFENIFDAHAHYDDKWFDDDREAVLDGLPSKGVCGVVNNAVDLRSAEDVIALAERYDYIYAAVGFHPENILDMPENWLEGVARLTEHPKVVAIGETGLDSLRGAPLDRQTEIFERHLQLAQSLRKPLIIHCVRTSQQVLASCRRLGVAVPVAIHGMRGNERVAQPLLGAGFYLSFGPQFNPATVLATPHDRLLIETDDSGQCIEAVAARIAPLLGITAATLLTQAAANLQRFLTATH